MKCIKAEPNIPVTVSSYYGPLDFHRFASADEYMKYWLAWEYVVKENRCVYRKYANCLGTALELSYLYTRPWQREYKEEIFEGEDYYDKEAGYGDPPKWYKGLGQLFSLGGMYAGHVAVTIGTPADGPYHFAIVTNHYEGGRQLCFEKQTPHLPDVYYRLIPCDEILYPIEQVVYPPSVYPFR